MPPIGPPPGVPAERLFRLLLQAPRAAWPVTIPIAGAPPGAFRVLALRPLEVDEAFDAAADTPPAIRQRRIDAELAVRALHDARGRVFADIAELGIFDDGDARTIVAACAAALMICSPSLRWIDRGAWHIKLVDGVEDNRGVAIRLALSVDGHVISGPPRPDRFFDVPMGHLTDGQWLAYRAARHVFVDSEL